MTIAFSLISLGFILGRIDFGPKNLATQPNTKVRSCVFKQDQNISYHSGDQLKISNTQQCSGFIVEENIVSFAIPEMVENSYFFTFVAEIDTKKPQKYSDI